jgi:hypothetical protein
MFAVFDFGGLITENMQENKIIRNSCFCFGLI